MSGASRKNNKIIREELPGGAETLDALELMHKVSDRHCEATEAGKISRLAETKLNEIKAAMLRFLKKERGDPR